MKKKSLILFIFLIFSAYGYAQKIYVWCPPEAEISQNTQKLQGIKMNMVISDARHITDTSKVECSSADLIQTIARTVTVSFPSAIINLLDSTAYHKATEKGKITIKIGISAYHSASGTDVSAAIGNAGGDFNWGVLPKNKWNSVAGFHVVIEDFRKDEMRTLTRDIANIVSRPNIGGSLTAKKALIEAFREASRELLYFIESTLSGNTKP